jgi:hypothetical protein
LPVAPTPPERKPVFFRRSALPPGSVTYRMLPMTVLKEVLHVICPETCPGHCGGVSKTFAPKPRMAYIRFDGSGLWIRDRLSTGARVLAHPSTSCSQETLIPNTHRPGAESKYSKIR